MVYLPRVKSMKLLHTGYWIGPYLCTFGTDCDNLPQLQIQYLHIMYLHKDMDPMPIFATACETNRHVAEAKARGESVEATYAFGIFPNTETRHITVSWSDEWADFDKFIAKSLEVVRDQYKLSEALIKMPMENAPERMVFYPDA